MSWLPSILGLVLWILLMIYSSPGDIYKLLFLFAPLVVVPLSLVLIRDSFQSQPGIFIYRTAFLLQPLGAIAAVGSFQTETGIFAAALATCWLLITCLYGLSGILLFFQKRDRAVSVLCIIAGLLYLPVGGAWFVSSRLGLAPLGFQEPIILLTAIHFHYTGFAAPVLVALAGNSFWDRGRTASRLFPLIAILTISGTPLLAIGFVFSPLLKLVAAIMITLGLSTLALIQLFSLKKISTFAAIFLAISNGSIVTGVSLALLYAWGEYHAQMLIGISEMAWTHGILNAFGFTFCGLIAWALERR